MAETLWKLEQVTLGRGGRPRLDGVSLEIRTGVTAILGESGAGKTSLLNLLVGFEQPDRGRISAHILEGRPSGSPPPFFWVPQEGGLWPHLTVRAHLELARAAETSDEAIATILSDFDLADKATAHPDQLSLGERARLAVARALVTGAAVLVMDEPFAHVDRARVSKYWDMVHKHLVAHGDSTGRVARGGSLVFSTHSPKMVLASPAAADEACPGHVVCLRDGRALYDGDIEKLYRRPPSRELAECLGEANWLTSEEARRWLQHEACPERAARCFRPEQVTIVPTTNGPVVVESSRFLGDVAEADLRHEASGEVRRFYHRPAADHLRKGERVILKLLTCLMLLMAVGCGGSSDPRLPVREMRSWLLPLEGAKLPAPRSVTLGRDGERVVLDTAGRVLVFAESGALKRQWSMPDVSVGKPEGVCVLGDGRIVVGDTHYHRVVIFDMAGRLLRQIGREGTGAGEFVFPVGVTKDTQDNFFVCEYGGNDRVQKFDRDGKFLTAFGSFGTAPGQFQRPSGMVWRDGKLYVADAINNRIQIFSDRGEFLKILGAPNPSPLHFPYDLTLGDDGALYVVEYGAGRVTKLSLEGALLGRFGSAGVGDGQFKDPWGIAWVGPRLLWVVDTGNRRVMELRL